MRYFPVFMDLHRQRVLVVGGGVVAERKIRLLLKAGAQVDVVATELSENVADWKDQGQIEHISLFWNEDFLAGARLVFAATDDESLNQAVYALAEQRGIPVNVVDNQALCRFISPAIVDRSPIQVAISTAGTAPVLARKIRGWIERLLPQNLGRIASAAGDARVMIKRAMPETERRTFWERLLNDARLLRWSNCARGEISC